MFNDILCIFFLSGKDISYHDVRYVRNVGYIEIWRSTGLCHFYMVERRKMTANETVRGNGL